MEQGVKLNDEVVAAVTILLPQTATVEKTQEENQHLKYPVCHNMQ
jgi:hypothetical protein